MKTVYVAERGGVPIVRDEICVEAYPSHEGAQARIDVTPLRRLGAAAIAEGLQPETVRAYVAVEDVVQAMTSEDYFTALMKLVETAQAGEPIEGEGIPTYVLWVKPLTKDWYPAVVGVGLPQLVRRYRAWGRSLIRCAFSATKKVPGKEVPLTAPEVKALRSLLQDFSEFVGFERTPE